MPTYDYVCDICGCEFEKFQPITAGPLKKCPKCGKLKLKRLIGTGAGIIFKGKGFYETDYRSDSYKKGKEKEKSQKTDSKSTGKKDNKPAETKSKKTSDTGSSDKGSSQKPKD